LAYKHMQLFRERGGELAEFQTKKWVENNPLLRFFSFRRKKTFLLSLCCDLKKLRVGGPGGVAVN
jgi:hypothetical protein